MKKLKKYWKGFQMLKAIFAVVAIFMALFFIDLFLLYHYYNGGRK